MINKIFNSERGQALLIIVLVMVVSLTIGLAIASKSIVNIRISTEEENSQRAFSAAEAGVERALQEDCTLETCTIAGPNLDNESNFDVTIKTLSGGNALLNGGTPVDQDNGADIWFVSHINGRPDYSTAVSGGNVKVYWGDPSVADCSNAAIEIIIMGGKFIAGQLQDLKVDRLAYDGCADRSLANSFTGVTAGTDEPSFKYNTLPITMNSLGGGRDIYLIRVVPLYFSSQIYVKTQSVTLPIQGKNIESTGKSGQTERKIKYYRGYPQLPIELFYTLFVP